MKTLHRENDNLTRSLETSAAYVSWDCKNKANYLCKKIAKAEPSSVRYGIVSRFEYQPHAEIAGGSNFIQFLGSRR